MRKVIIAVDVDGTLIRNTNPETRVHGQPDNDDVPHVPIINTVMVLSKLFKNVRIVVWSGGGKDYAALWGHRLGLDDYVWRYASKLEAGELRKLVDRGNFIAIDDIQDTELGDVNLIVRLK